MSFSWKPIYREIAERVRAFSSRSPELAALVIEMRREGLKVIPTRDLDVGDVEIEIEDIDPFSFFACFNRNATHANRQQILSWLKNRWGLESAIPEDFNGLPLVNPQRSWYMLYKKDRRPEHIPLLWRFYETLFGLSSPFDLDTDLFDQCCEIPGVKPTNLTMGMFWIRPDLFFALDRKNLLKAELLGLESKPTTGQEYLDWLRRLQEKYQGEIANFSYDAHISVSEKPLALPYSRLFRDMGHADEVLDVFADALKAMGYPERQPNDEFLSITIREKSPRQWVMGVNCGPWAAFSFRSWNGVYSYMVVVPQDHPLCDPSLGELLKDKLEGKRYGWTSISESDIEAKWPEVVPSLKKVGTSFQHYNSPYRRHHQPKLLELVTVPQSRERLLREPLLPSKGIEPDLADINHWWVSVDPNEFQFNGLNIGAKIRLPANTPDGLKRQIQDAFKSAKQGDRALIYLRSPERFVWGCATVTSQLGDHNQIEFRIEQKYEPRIMLESFSGNLELTDCKALKYRKGTLCPLREDEYEIILSDVTDKAEPELGAAKPVSDLRRYQVDDALADLFIDKERVESLRDLLRRKKNIVLQGAPGTGKTFIAKRLAYLLAGYKDDSSVTMVQFHPTTSYEDFVQGFRPAESGGFQLRNGVFFEFCRRAIAAPQKPHIFIIDEINRGNLSKILGELMLLIETEKRSPEFALPLTYSGESGETFYVPDNIYLIGTMNTADRSLSLVDYALRRRFSFVELTPGFNSPRFESVLRSKEVSQVTINELKSRMAQLNELIASDERSLGRGFCIGHSFFVPSQPVSECAKWLKEIIDYEIAPLLEEYWVDEPKKLADALAIARGQP